MVRVSPPCLLPNTALAAVYQRGGNQGEVQMSSSLRQWAVSERQFLNEEIKYLKAGGKVMSPSGENISVGKLAELDARLEGVNLALKETDDAKRA